MLKFRWHSIVGRIAGTAARDARHEGSLLDRSDLRIGNLLDDPRLRRAMDLDLTDDVVPAESTASARPTPRFDRRRRLDDAAA